MAEVTPTRDPCREGESLAIEPAGLLSSCQRPPNTLAFVTKSHCEETEARTHRSEKFSRRCGRRGQPRTAEAEPGAEGTKIDQNDPDSGWDDSGRECWEVPESLIIGKAFCVYWPHLKPAWPEFRLGPDQRFPVRPYFERIRWIR